jgi:aspartate/tyrosine/aromatic aminotransferase
MYPGISEEDVKELAERFSIFVPLNGRFSVSGFNKNNIQIIADALVYLHNKHNK